jgi:hypothetical protein
MAPNNIKQVQNAQVMERKKFRLGRGGFYNLQIKNTRKSRVCQARNP